jgi:flavin reductase (DIM6/NTAB) family NADH-FMN oxidoreductase RutF
MPVGSKKKEKVVKKKVVAKNITKKKKTAKFPISNMERIIISRLYKFLEPGPTILLITAEGEKANLVTLSSQMILNEENAIIGIGMGPWAHSYHTLLKTKECVIAIPTVGIINEVVKIGNCSGEDVDKFSEFNLTKSSAETVNPPLLKEARVNIECAVVDFSLLNKYRMFVLKAKKAWYNPSISDKRFIHHNGNGIFTIDGDQIDIKHLMTNWPEHVANR